MACSISSKSFGRTLTVRFSEDAIDLTKFADAIAGTPLNDSYHFGQTIINDFGRPYHQGFNAVSGITGRAENGHFFFYARGEYQNAPSAAAYPDSVRNVIAQADINPVQPATPVPATNQFRLLDTYAGVTVLGNAVSVGKQSFWWGTGESGMTECRAFLMMPSSFVSTTYFWTPDCFSAIRGWFNESDDKKISTAATANVPQGRREPAC